MAKHTIGVLVENRPGVLTRVSGLFARRGFNIDSLAVGTTEEPNVSRMTIVVDGDDNVLEQITKQLNKLIDVIRVIDLSETAAVHRELVLIRVAATTGNRSEIMQIVDVFRARIVDVAEDSLIVEATGDEPKVKAFEGLLRKFGVKEIARTGRVSLSRGGLVDRKKKLAE